MNKLFKSATLIALVAFGAIATQSCRKGEEDPGLSLRGRDGRLSGTWMMKTIMSTSEDVTEYVDQDPANEGDLEKSESTSEESWDGTTYSMTETSMSTVDNGDTYSDEMTLASGILTMTETSKIDGSSETEEVTGTYTASWSAEYTFEKDGTFSMTMSKTTSSEYDDDDSDGAYDLNVSESETDNYTVTGTWAWLGENKSAEIEDKERVAIWWDDETVVSESEYEEDYTDTDSGDFFDYDEDDETISEESTSTYSGSSAEPDEIWTLIQLANDEMKAEITGTYTNEYEGITRYSDFFGNSVSETEYTSSGSYKTEVTFEKQ